MDSNGVVSGNFAADGDSAEMIAWGSIFFQLGDDLHAAFGGGGVTMVFKGSDGLFHPFKSISYTVSSEALLTLPKGVKLCFKLRLTGSTTPNLNYHVLCGGKLG